MYSIFHSGLVNQHRYVSLFFVQITFNLTLNFHSLYSYDMTMLEFRILEFAGELRNCEIEKFNGTTKKKLHQEHQLTFG